MPPPLPSGKGLQDAGCPTETSHQWAPGRTARRPVQPEILGELSGGSISANVLTTPLAHGSQKYGYGSILTIHFLGIIDPQPYASEELLSETQARAHTHDSLKSPHYIDGCCFYTCFSHLMIF